MCQGGRGEVCGRELTRRSGARALPRAAELTHGRFAPPCAQLCRLTVSVCLVARPWAAYARSRELSGYGESREGPIMSEHILEPAAQEFANLTSQPPFLYELGPVGARKVLDDVQAAPIAQPEVDEQWITVPAEIGDVRVRVVKPVGGADVLPVILYLHGGGWIL